MDISLLAVGKMSAESVGGGPASSKCTSQKNTMPFSIASVDNPLLTTTVSEKATDNIITDNTQTDFNTKASRSINNKLGKKTVRQEANEIGDKDKTKDKTKDLAAEVFPFGNLRRSAKSKESLIANKILNNVLATGIDSPYNQNKAEKNLVKPTQLENKLCANTPKSVLQRTSGKLLIADKAVIKKGTFSSLNPYLVAGKLCNAYYPKSVKTSASSVQLHAPADLKAISTFGRTTLTNKKPAATDQIAGFTDNKTPVLAFNSQIFQRKTADTEQKALTGQGKSTFVSGKQTDSVPSTKVVNNGDSDGKTLAGLVVSSKKESSNNNTSSSSSQNGQAHFQKLNLAEIQIGPDWAKNYVNSTTKNGSDADFATIFSPNNTQSFVSGQTSAATHNIKIADLQGQSISSGVIGVTGKQIIESIRASLQQADNNVTVRLNPPELGNVLVKLQEQESELTGLLQVSKVETKYDIEQELPQIIRALTDNGVQIKRLDVQLAEQHEPDVGRNPNGEGLENDSYQHHRFAEGNNPENNNDKELLIDISENSYQDHPETQLDPSRQTGESINMLI
jgi:flagellar hook-length control protein FliK